MKFIVIITRSIRKTFGSYQTTGELKREEFDAPSIIAAKARATKIANATVFLENKIKWDDSNGNIIGKELRWLKWDEREPYEENNGVMVGSSGKRSDTFYGNWDPETDVSPTYIGYVTVYWNANGQEKTG